jgi:ATP-dependent protease HslVU (ClpYQ) peptidase subunit
MTVIVGVLCSDGVVIGTDSSATFGDGLSKTIEQPTRKLEVVQQKLLVCCTGSVGLAQRFVDTLSALHAGNQLRKSPTEIGRTISTAALDDFMATHAHAMGQQRLNTVSLGAVVAGVLSGRPYLLEFASFSLQPEEKRADQLWFVALGSGQPIADPFLGFLRRAVCPEGQPSLATGKLLTAWTLDHVCDTNPGGVKEPWHIGVIEKVNSDWRARLLPIEELDEHKQMVRAIEADIATAPHRILNRTDAPPIPEG